LKEIDCDAQMSILWKPLLVLYIKGYNGLWVHGQFARKDRGNKKAKYRNKLTGKFTFKIN
jgi:hypothetical protein